jgi:uncharacterized protein (TIGR00251 family)
MESGWKEASTKEVAAALDEANKGVLIRLHVQPGAKRSRLQGLHGDAIKLQVQAPPVDGRANKAVIELLASALQVRPASIELTGGASSRRKRVLCKGLTLPFVHARLALILSG